MPSSLFFKFQQKYADSKNKFKQVKQKTEQKIKRVMDDANKKQDHECVEFKLYNKFFQASENKKLHRRLDHNEEVKAQLEVRSAETQCLETIKDHYRKCIQSNPDSTYEEWIGDLHPENFYFDKEGVKEIDCRFYARDSVHRCLWNKNLNGRRHEVAPKITSSKSYMGDLFWFEKRSYNVEKEIYNLEKDDTAEITFI